MTGTPGAADGTAASHAKSGNSKPDTDLVRLRAEIAQTRTDLGQTVQALAAKADVKARLHETADETKARVRLRLHTAADEARAAAADAPARAQKLARRAGDVVRRNPVPFAVAAGALVALVTLIRWRRSR